MSWRAAFAPAVRSSPASLPCVLWLLSSAGGRKASVAGKLGRQLSPALHSAFARSDRSRKGVVMGVGRTRRAGSAFNAFDASPFHGRTASSSISHQRVGCIECALEYDNEPDLEEAYCPNCGARNPECVEWVALAELQAAEEAFSRGRSDPAG